MERNEAEEKMLGFYDYTVVLTYCSVISAVIGIYVSLSGAGHPYIGVMLLLLCGLFDTFDGRVARSKKNRTEKEKAFGVQIDSLSSMGPQMIASQSCSSTFCANTIFSGSCLP